MFEKPVGIELNLRPDIDTGIYYIRLIPVGMGKHNIKTAADEMVNGIRYGIVHGIHGKLCKENICPRDTELFHIRHTVKIFKNKHLCPEYYLGSIRRKCAPELAEALFSQRIESRYIYGVCIEMRCRHDA